MSKKQEPNKKREAKQDPHEESTKRIAKAIREIIDQQVYNGEPAETQDAMERLVEDGFSQKEAYNLIGMVVSAEVFEILKEGKSFNEERYAKALNDLPAPFAELPEEEGPDKDPAIP